MRDFSFKLTKRDYMSDHGKERIEELDNLRAKMIYATIENMTLQRESVKKEFAEIIKDQSIPLDERWFLFKNTPREFKEHCGWIVHFSALQEIKNLEYECFKYYERRESIDTAECLVDLFEDNVYYYINYPEECEVGDEEKYTRDRLNRLKEEILSKNLGSFDYDW